LVAPLVHVELDFYAPARFDQELTIIARLHQPQAPRVDFTYEIVGDEQKLIARGRTVQVFARTDGSLVLTMPEVYRRFLERTGSQFAEVPAPGSLPEHG
jgi:acyl-CoA thioesterase FadM